jgi:hypothetical protein
MRDNNEIAIVRRMMEGRMALGMVYVKIDEGDTFSAYIWQ